MMTAQTPLHDTPAPQSGLHEIGVWLIQGEDNTAPCEQLLSAAPGTVLCGVLSPAPGSLTALRPGPGKVLLVTSSAVLTGDWLEQARTAGMGVVVSSVLSADHLFRWGDRASVVFVPLNPSAESLRLAIISAEMAARRETLWREACDELRNRLNDRILLERAKGVLVQRLGVSEEEAYRRIRGMARRQRRSLHDVAQAVLDAGTILEPVPAAVAVAGGKAEQ